MPWAADDVEAKKVAASLESGADRVAEDRPRVDVDALTLSDTEAEPAGTVVSEEVDANVACKAAAHLGDLDLEHHLQRRRGLEAAHHLGAVADKGLDQAVRLLDILRGGDGAGEQHQAVHRRRLNARLRHRQRQHLVDRTNVRADPHIGGIEHPAGLVGGVDRGLAGRLAEDVDLAAGPDLDVGDAVIGHEQVAHCAVELDQASGAGRERDVVARLRRSGGLSEGGRGSRGAEAGRDQRGHRRAERHARGELGLAHLTWLPPERR
jgi:hypothetical protein